MTRFKPVFRALSRGGAALFFLLYAGEARANGLSIANVALTSPNSTAKTIQVQFDISWNNSWRNLSTYDAAWVFIKYTTQSSAPYTWRHCTLKTSGTNPSGVSSGTGTALDIVVSADKKGAFLQRNSSGKGTVSSTAVQLVWDWNADGLSASDSAKVQAFGLEMVYVPQASFTVGDGTVNSVGGQFC